MNASTVFKQWKALCSVRKYLVKITATTTSVYQLPPEDTRRLLAPTTSSSNKPAIHGADLLNAVRRLDEWTAEKLACRDDTLDNFRFKVIQGGKISPSPVDPLSSRSHVLEMAPDTEQISSFLAVSYCWHYKTWEPALGLQYRSASSEVDPQFPLMPAMLAAVLQERCSGKETVWLDQWCVNQKDNNEVLIAVGMMDLVYSHARKVLICLEDVRLDCEDMETLLEFGRCLEGCASSSVYNKDIQGWENQNNGHLFEAVTKIFAARWFSRAWCAHEYWLARDSIFLVPITLDPENAMPDDAAATILRFNAKFLSAAHYLTCSWIPGDQADSTTKMVRHWEEHVKNTHPYYWDGIIDFQRGQLNARVAFTWSMSHFGGLGQALKAPKHQQTFAMVNTLGTTKIADKLAVTLNVGRTGLYLNTKREFSAAEIAWMACIIALASRDAAPLASTGPPIRSLGTGEIGGKSRAAIGWACVPELDRYERVDDLSFERDLPILISERGLELDVIHLGSSRQICVPENLKTCLAEAAIDWLCAYEKQTYTFFNVPLRRRHMVQALSCLLTGRADWAIACAAAVRLHPTDPLRYLRLAESRSEIEAGFEALSMIRVLEVGGSSVPSLLIHTMEKIDGLKALVTVADGLVRTVIGEQIEYQLGTISEISELQVCVSNTEAHGGIVIFAPPASEIDYELVCPEVLRKKDEFNKSTRKGWVVQANTGTVYKSYRLLDKTALVMPLAFDLKDAIKDKNPFSIYLPVKILITESDLSNKTY